MIVEVCVNYYEANIDKVFDYLVPNDLEEQIDIGKRVYVEFGSSNRIVEGLIVNQKSMTQYDKLKCICAVIDDDPIVTKEQIALAFTMKRYYAMTLSEALALLIPPFIVNKSAYLIYAKEKDIENIKESLLFIYEKIKDKPKSYNGSFAKKHKDKITELILDGYLKLSLKPIDRVIRSTKKTDDVSYTLTDEQKRAIDVIKTSIDHEIYKNILLYGVTGSGKTEVYIQAIRYVLSKGKSALLLVPEISLTPQMIENIQKRIDTNISVYHSKMSDLNRYESWYNAKNGITKLVIGPRSAIFTPLKDIGIIIVDEEHEQSYKSDKSPRVNAVEIAQMRAKINNIPIILGSATPSVEHFYLAQSKKYQLVAMAERINKSFPDVRIVDMKKEVLEGNKSMFSRLLIDEININLNKNEQVLLFLNRRGYSTFVICKECGYVYECEKCSISLTYHKSGLLKCHYCNHTERFDGICPKCKSKYVRLYGSGTQRIEDEIKKYFTDVRVLRMDRDTTSKKGSTDEIIRKFSNKEADILIGTQMVAKGLHFPDLTLVGVINADTILNMPDFRSKERTFQLITQVAGRSGRDVKNGRVVIQTFNPMDYSIVSASKHDYISFYKEEIKIRKILNYPPFVYIANLITISNSFELSKKGIERVDKILREILDMYKMEIYGPSENPIFKIENSFRYHILVKFFKLSDMIDVVNKLKERYNYNGASLLIDVNPSNTL